jgi:rubrerythrin
MTKKTSEILYLRTEDAFQKEDFADRHFEIVNAVLGEGLAELAQTFDPETLKKIEQLLVRAIDQASNAFRKFAPKDGQKVYQNSDWNDRTITGEYQAAVDATGPIADEFSQLLLDKAELDVNADEFLSTLNIKDLMLYAAQKIGLDRNSLAKELESVTEDKIQAVIDEVVPVGERWDFDNEVIASINYLAHEDLSANENLATDLLFVLMNQLWKVQQVHRAFFETRTKLDGESLVLSDKRIAENRLEYRSYTDFLTESFHKWSEKSVLHGLVFVAYGIQKDLMVYLRQ